MRTRRSWRNQNRLYKALGADLARAAARAEAKPTITAWSLAWLSRTMPACAFWYYRTEAEARAEAAAMADYKTKVRAVQVPADFDRWAR